MIIRNGYKRSVIWKKQHSLFMKLHNPTDDPKVRKKISNANKGKHNPMYGRHLSKKLKEKLRRKRLGKTYEQIFGVEEAIKLRKAKLGRNNPNFGKHCSERTKEKLREKRIGKSFKQLYGRRKANILLKKLSIARKGLLKGKRNPAWNGGTSFKPYTSDFDRDFKSKIKQRDCFCQLCNTRSSLYIHHINYDKSHTTEDNCITLCNSCNCKVNVDRDYWFAYFRYIMDNNNQNIH